MDVEMPGMGGLEAVERLMDETPTPVLMLSAHTAEGAEVTFEALERGAVDFFSKPGGEVSTGVSRESDRLVEAVRSVADADLDAATRDRREREAADSDQNATISRVSTTSTPPATTEIDGPLTVVIGASTGGPNAVERVMSALPMADCRVVIVQHMPEAFTTARFADRLDEASAYDVREASDGARIGSGEALVARGGSHTRIDSYRSGRLRVKLDEDDSQSVTPAADVTMRSAAAVVDGPLVGVVLTGMGADASEGIRAMADAGARTIAQSEDTCVIYGMPKRAVETGGIGEIHDLDDVAGAIVGVRPDGLAPRRVRRRGGRRDHRPEQLSPRLGGRPRGRRGDGRRVPRRPHAEGQRRGDGLRRRLRLRTRPRRPARRGPAGRPRGDARADGPALRGVDTVEAMVSEIADTGDVSTDPSDLEGRLREMEEHGTVGGEDGDGDADSGTDASDADDADADGGDEDGGVNEASADEDPESSEDDAEDISVPELPDAAAALDDPVVYADVTIGEAAMAGVDAALVLQALDGQFGEYVTVPGPEALEDGEYDERFDVFVADADEGVVAEGLGALTQVESIATGLVEDGEDGEDVEHGEHGEDGEDGEDGDAVDDGSEAAVGVGGADDADDANESAKDDSSSNSKSDSNSGDEIKSIRVDVDQVDELYGLVEQLVTSRIKLRRELEATDAQSDTLDELDKLASSLQDTAMDMRLIPFSQVSDSFPRLVRDISRDLGKRIDFEIEGDDVELDRTILTEMRDPLVHVLRNAVDHGIETPEEREVAGKEPTGHVRLTAERERDHVIIEVADDGGGSIPTSSARRRSTRASRAARRSRRWRTRRCTTSSSTPASPPRRR